MSKKTETKRRGNHSGRLELRGKKWLAIWMVNGKRQSQSTGETDRAAAEKWLARKLETVKTADGMKALDKDEATIREMQAALLKGQLLDIQGKRDELDAATARLRFDETWDTYERTPKRKEVTADTLRLMRTRWSQFADWMKKHHPDVAELRHVTPEVAAEYAAHIRPRYVPATYNLTLAALSQIWTTLAREIEYTTNPWARECLPRLNVPLSERRDISDDELARIFTAARKEVPPLHYLFTVMLHTGARLGDCAKLRWEDIDLERGFISFIPQKGKRYGERARVKIPILPPLRVMLDSYPADKRVGYVMPDMATEYEAGRLGDTITTFFRTKCGITTSRKTEVGKRAHPVVTAHSFRHTFVSKAANAGIPFAIVQQIVGHQTAEMCRHYFHENEDATLRAFASFPTATPAQIEAKPDVGEVIDVEAVTTTAAEKPTADRRAALEAALAEIEKHGDADERRWAATLLAKAAKELAHK